MGATGSFVAVGLFITMGVTVMGPFVAMGVTVMGSFITMGVTVMGSFITMGITAMVSLVAMSVTVMGSFITMGITVMVSFVTMAASVAGTPALVVGRGRVVAPAVLLWTGVTSLAGLVRLGASGLVVAVSVIARPGGLSVLWLIGGVLVTVIICQVAGVFVVG